MIAEMMRRREVQKKWEQEVVGAKADVELRREVMMKGKEEEEDKDKDSEKVHVEDVGDVAKGQGQESIASRLEKE